MKHTPGIDMSTGSLGQGISAAVGMALAAKLSQKAYRVYTLVGDGELQEGQVWEAAMFAAHRKLDNLVVIVDNNNLQIDGTVEEVNSPYSIDEKFRAFGFHVITIDGHDFTQISDAFCEARKTQNVPAVIIARTVKGKGVSFMENQVGWHGKAPDGSQLEQALVEIQDSGYGKGGDIRMTTEENRIATRDSYGATLVELGKQYEELVVMDADLAGATKTGIFRDVFPDRHIDCGIAECNMMGIAAGLAASGKNSICQYLCNVCSGKSI